MDFTKLKLNEMLAQGAGPSLSVNANNKASQQAQAPKQTTNTANSLGMQQNSMAQKTGNVKAKVVQKQGGAPAKVATTGQATSTVENYFADLHSRKAYIKELKSQTSNWKKELTEALGLDDEVDHPFVEVMPFKDFKFKEAQELAKKEAKKPGSATNAAQSAVQAQLPAGLMGEEIVVETRKEERGLTNDQKILNRDKAAGDEDTGAQARRAFRHLALRGHKKRRGR